MFFRGPGVCPLYSCTTLLPGLISVSRLCRMRWEDKPPAPESPWGPSAPLLYTAAYLPLRCFPSLHMEVTFPKSQPSSNFWVTSQTLKKSAHFHWSPPPCEVAATKRWEVSKGNCIVLQFSEILQWPTTLLPLESKATWYTEWLSYFLSWMEPHFSPKIFENRQRVWLLVQQNESVSS